MKKKEKLVILVLLIITIALVVVGIVTKKTNNNGENSQIANNSEEKIPSLDEEHVVTLEDGTRLSTSKALKKNKSFDGITLTDIQLTEKENKTVLLGTLTNKTNEKKGGYYVNIVLEDENGNALKSLRTFIDELESGESNQLHTQVTLDYVNAYDFSVEL